MMPKATRSQLEALTALLHQLRHDWDLPGIRAALAKAAPSVTGADLAVAACRVASDPEMRTPGMIPQPGAHWSGTAAGQRQAPTMCPEHTDQKAGHCRGCVALSVPRPADFVVPHPSRLRKRETKPEPEPSRTQEVRDRMDAEAGESIPRPGWVVVPGTGDQARWVPAMEDQP